MTMPLLLLCPTEFTFFGRIPAALYLFALSADPLPVQDMYYSRKSNPQNPDWVTVRGTSKLEGYHPHLARALPGTGYATDTAGGIFSLFNMMWNLKRGIENCGQPDHGCTEAWLQSNLSQLSRSLGLSAEHFKSVSVPDCTTEKFGVEYEAEPLDRDAALEAEKQGLAVVEPELSDDEEERLLAATALDAMRFIGEPCYLCSHHILICMLFYSLPVLTWVFPERMV